MSRKNRIDLERLADITNTEKDLLKSLYGDMFGSSAGTSDKRDNRLHSGKESVRDRFSSKEPSLKEAQDLMARTDEITQGILESNRKGAENLANLTAEAGGIEPAGGPSNPGNGSGNGQPPVQTATGGPVPEPAEEKPAEPEKDPMEELEALVGLTTIKEDVKELTAFAKIQKMRKDAGLRSVPVSLHLVFTGNPGTGKTTVARIIGRLYKQIGVLSKGQLIEVDRSGLVATQDQIKKALGGVLFIDEAYALAQKDDAFGQEAIDTVLKAMEDHRDDLVVIVAGYTDPMEKFINSNPGLKSRFNKYIEFPDYTIDELEQIFYLNCGKYDYVVEEDAKKQIRARIVSRKMQRRENFANAREVRNMFEDIITNQARRVAEMEAPTHDDMMTITLMDLSDDIGDVADTKEMEKMEAAALEAKAPELVLSNEEEKEPSEQPAEGSDSAAGEEPAEGSDSAAGEEPAEQ